MTFFPLSHSFTDSARLSPGVLEHIPLIIENRLIVIDLPCCNQKTRLINGHNEISVRIERRRACDDTPISEHGPHARSFIWALIISTDKFSRYRSPHFRFAERNCVFSSGRRAQKTRPISMLCRRTREIELIEYLRHSLVSSCTAI